MNGKKLTAMGLIVTLSLSAMACGKTEEPEEVSKVAVEVQNPEIGELTVDTTYIGTVSPQEQVYVIPKASGTVTETFFDVGDTVKEGDVLFKIDDEAYQLQLASAKAAYDTAQAGVTAQSSGARDLQNYQTEEQIRQLRDSLYDTDDKIDEMEDNLGDIRDAGKSLSAAKTQAQAGVDAAETAYYAASSELEPQILAKQEEVAAKQDAVTKKQKEIDDAILANGNEADVTVLQEELSVLKEESISLEKELAALQNQLAGSKAAVDQARAGLSQIQTQIDSVNATKAQLKSGIDAAEDGRETINDNLAMAEQAYAITQNEIYPETDAASAAQLQQVAVGIDSAQMQLDYCTVTSPISGIVESANVEKNGMAAAGNVAYIISNKDSMKVTFNVTEQAKNALAVGDHVTVERNGQTYDGNITQIGTMAGQQTKLFAIEATVTGAGDSLPNGVSAKVYATTQKAEGKLIVPYDSVYFSAGDAYVYCVENDTVIKTEVTVGLMSDTQAVIEEGITADSLIVDNWSSKLRDGAEVDVVSINGEAVVNEASETEETEETTEETEETTEETEETTEEEETPEEGEVSEETDVTEEAE